MHKSVHLPSQSTRPQTVGTVRKNIVPSRPFTPVPRDVTTHDPTYGSCPANPATAYGIHSRQKQLIIHLQNDYRKGVGICLVNRQGLVFAAKRKDDTEGTWQMPQGGIDPAEDPVDAALRELKEETGIGSARIVASLDQWLHYDFSTQVRAQLGSTWLRYRGQKQKWFLVQYLGEDDSEIDLSCEGTGHKPEFSEFKWMALDHLPERVVSFKQPVYQEVHRHFTPLISRLVSEKQSWS